MPDSRNVVAGKPLTTGGVRIGPTGTAAPTNATSEPDVGFVAVGYIGEDGLTEATDRSTEKVRAWGGDVVKVLQTDFATTYSFVFLETLNADVLKAVYGDTAVTTTPATASAGTLHAVKIQGEQLPRKAFLFEVKDGDAKVRIHVPQGQITETGEVTYADGEVVGYEVTLEAFRDPTLAANAMKYVDDGRPTGA